MSELVNTIAEMEAYRAGAEAFRLAAMNAIEAEVRSLEGKLPKRASFTTQYATNSLRAAERAVEVLLIPLPSSVDNLDG